MPKIAIVEDDALLREQIVLSLSKEFQVVQAGDRLAGEKLLVSEQPEVLLVDLHLPPSGKALEGLKLVEQVTKSHLDTIVIVMSGDEDMKATFKAIGAGAHDYFKKPFDFAELKLIIRRALQKQKMQRENERLKEELQGKYSFQNIIGQSPQMLRMFDAIRRVAGSNATVMIRGESGTGKELIARALHYNSPRRDQAFVSINCAALPETLVESELFGHERGSFTGAISTHVGKFEQANHGTLFLDEIGAISMNIQAKLLRVLEDRRVERVGGSHPIQAEVRLITATNEDLEKKVGSGEFREDLYYRVKVFPIFVSPLRERTEDIPLLLDHFLRIFCNEHHVPLKKFDPPALDALTNYVWKGNVRELENLVQTLVLLCDVETIGVRELPSYVIGSGSPSGRPAEVSMNGLRFDQAVERFESELIRSALDQAGGVKIKAASLLGIDKNRMKYLCRKYKL